MNAQETHLEAVRSEIAKTLGDAPVFMVGGCVRDSLLGRKPKDFDAATPLQPDVVETLVKASGRRAFLTGKRFGTIGFKVRFDGTWQFVEVTTYRKEVYTEDSRKPEVQFVNELEEDLSRRDLTINAIAFAQGIYIDPFKGKKDITDNILRTVGKPKDRFTEDPLRLLRVARFAAQLDFKVDPKLLGEAQKLATSIYDVSRERWMQELDSLFTTDRPWLGIETLEKLGVMKYMLPEVWLLGQIYNPIKHMPEDLYERIEWAWVNLLAEIGRPYAAKKSKLQKEQIIYPSHELISAEMTLGIAKRLKWSRERTATIYNAVRMHKC